MEQKTSIELSSAKIWVHENQIIWQNYKLTKSLNLEEARGICEAVNEIACSAPDGKKLLLSSMTSLLSMDGEVRKYFVDYPSDYEWEIAMVYSCSVAHIFTSLILRLNPRFETKSFNNLEKAMNWLRGFALRSITLLL